MLTKIIKIHNLISRKNLLIKYLILILFLALFSCQESRDKDTNILVPLENTHEEMKYYDNFQSQFLLLSMRDLNPEFYQANLKKLHGIPNLDSFQVLTENMQDAKFFRAALFPQQYKQKFLVDSLKMSAQNSKYHLNLVSGYRNGKQILIIDANNNSNFSDEENLIYDNEFRFFKNNNPNINEPFDKIDTLPFIDLEYNPKSNNINRVVQVYPFSNHYYTQLLGESDLKNYAIGIRLKDYWIGDFSFNQVDYTVTVQGLNSELNTVMIKPKRFEYTPEDQNFNQNFSYSIKDTIQLSNEVFQIDSLSPDFSKLHLKKINHRGIYFGNRIGNTIQDFQMQNLNDRKFNISGIINQNKDYVLLDFWGTWCAPCKKLTPELIRIFNTYSNILDIISIASDEDIDNVIDYTSKNGMEWYHAFEKRNKKRGILKKKY